MPLSEHEQRLLSEMEQRLLADDPRFASAMRHSTTGGQPKQRLALGVLGVLIGLAGMLVAIYNSMVPFAVIGFVIMLGSAYWAIAMPKRQTGPQGVVSNDGTVQPPASGRRVGGSSRATRRPRRGSGEGFTQRMEQRWERRRETGNPGE